MIDSNLKDIVAYTAIAYIGHRFGGRKSVEKRTVCQHGYVAAFISAGVVRLTVQSDIHWNVVGRESERGYE